MSIAEDGVPITFIEAGYKAAKESLEIYWKKQKPVKVIKKSTLDFLLRAYIDATRMSVNPIFAMFR